MLFQIYDSLFAAAFPNCWLARDSCFSRMMARSLDVLFDAADSLSFNAFPLPMTRSPIMLFRMAGSLIVRADLHLRLVH